MTTETTTYNQIQQKQLALKVYHFEQKQPIPQIIMINNIQNIFLDKDDDDARAYNVFFDDLYICIGSVEYESLDIIMKRYENILKAYEKLIMADGGILIDVEA